MRLDSEIERDAVIFLGEWDDLVRAVLEDRQAGERQPRGGMLAKAQRVALDEIRHQAVIGCSPYDEVATGSIERTIDGVEQATIGFVPQDTDERMAAREVSDDLQAVVSRAVV